MNKNDLIQELNDPQKEAYNILIKGYLNHFEMDQELYLILRQKLVKEATQIYSNEFELQLNEDQLKSLKDKIDRLRKVVYSACYNELMDEDFIGKAFYKIKCQFTEVFKKQINHYIESGYSFLDENPDNTLEIVDFLSQTVFKIPDLSLKDIFQEWGIDVDHELYHLFFIVFIEQEELSKLKLSYCFSKHFNIKS